MRRSGLVLLLVLFITTAARADGTSGEVTLAREQFERGVAAAQASHWAEARDAFERAYKLHPHPTTLLNLAGAEAETGRVVAAAEYYRAVMRDPHVSAEEKSAAEQALARVEKRAAHVRVVVDGKKQPGDRVAIDGTAISSAAIGEDLPIDPGEHTAVLERNKHEAVRKSFALRESEATTIALEAPAPAAPPPSTPIESERGGGLFASPWFWTAVGVVVVGGTIGIVCAAGACKGDTAHPATGNAGPNVRLP